MKSEYEIWLDDPTGNRLKLLDQITTLRAIKAANTIGSLTIQCPDVYDDYIRLDGIIEVWRKAQGGSMRLFNAYFLRGWEYSVKGNKDVTILTGVDGNDWLKTRVVAYAAGTTNANRTDQADDMMKAIIRDNLTTDCSDTGRDMSEYISVAGDLAAGPSITFAFSWRKLADVIRDIAEASRQAGTNLYYDFVPVVNGAYLEWDFRTYTGQPGIDRTGTNQLIFGRKWGNLENPRLAFDYGNEFTVIYAGGRGTDTDRVIEEVEDTTRSGASVRNRREDFQNVSGQASTTDGYVAYGRARLEASRPKLSFGGQLVDTKTCRYGVEWNFGDKVIVEYRGYQFEAVITGVTLSVSDGEETVTGTFEVQ